jgi:DNA polymerase III delta prime subunit
MNKVLTNLKFIFNIFIPIILSYLLYNTINYGFNYIVIPPELKGWLMMSILGPITSSLLSASNWYEWAKSLFVYSHTWEQQTSGQDTVEWLSLYLIKNTIYSYDSITKVISNSSSVWWDDSSKNQERSQIYEIPAGWLITKYKNNYILVYSPYPKVSNAAVYQPIISKDITLYSFKKINWKTFLEDVRDMYYENIESSKISVYKNTRDYIGEDNRITIPSRKDPSIKMCFGNPEKEKAWNAVIDFFNPELKAHYKKLNQAYKKAFLIYGPPGTGKSELLYQIASYIWKEYQKPIYIINPKGLDDYDLGFMFEQIKSGFVLVDEWDMHIDEKGSMTKDNKYPSLSAWLTILDRAEGEIIFWFTSNNYKKIADFNNGALIRPGRIDHVIKFDLMNSSEVKNLWNHYVPDDPEIDNVDENQLNGMTVAKVVNHIKQYLPLSTLKADSSSTSNSVSNSVNNSVSNSVSNSVNNSPSNSRSVSKSKNFIERNKMIKLHKYKNKINFDLY